MIIRTYVNRQKVDSVEPKPTLIEIPLDVERERVNFISSYGYSPSLSDDDLKHIKVMSFSSIVDANKSEDEESETLYDAYINAIELKKESLASINAILNKDYEEAKKLWESGFKEGHTMIEIAEGEEDTIVEGIEKSDGFVRWVDRIVYDDIVAPTPTDLEIKGFRVGKFVVLCDSNNIEHMDYIKNHKDYTGETISVDPSFDDDIISVVQLKQMDANSDSSLSDLFNRMYDIESSETTVEAVAFKSPVDFGSYEFVHFPDNAENLEEDVTNLFRKINLD